MDATQGERAGESAAATAKRIPGRIALAVALALALAAPTAQAAPLTMTATEARANVGVQLSDAALLAAPATAPFSAQIDPATGQITDGTLTVPDFQTHITSPIDADVTVQFAIGQITGSYDQATGALSGSGTAGGTLSANGHQCTVATVPSTLTLTTAGQSGGANPRVGVPFADGLAGYGAVAGTWTDMTATPVTTPDDTTFCQNVYAQIGGPGGIWLEQQATGTGLPVCTATSASTTSATPVALTLNCTGDSRTIRVTAPPAHGTLGQIDQANGTLTYTPAAGYSGADGFAFEAANFYGSSHPAVASVDVQPKTSASPPPPPKHKCPRHKRLKHGHCANKHKRHPRH